MLANFSSILFDLMVWVGGGIPSETVDIRLGDVVTSKPLKEFGGDIQYRSGKMVEEGRFDWHPEQAAPGPSDRRQ